MASSPLYSMQPFVTAAVLMSLQNCCAYVAAKLLLLFPGKKGKMCVCFCITMAAFIKVSNGKQHILTLFCCIVVMLC